MPGRIEIDEVSPVVSCGEYPAKAVVGEVVAVRATVWREGHEAVAATLVVRYHGPHYPQLVSAPAGLVLPDAPAPQPGTDRVKPLSVPMVAGGQPDTFEALFTPDAVGLWTFRVDGWGDPVTGWRAAVTAKLEGKIDPDLKKAVKEVEGWYGELSAAKGDPRQVWETKHTLGNRIDWGAGTENAANELKKDLYFGLDRELGKLEKDIGGIQDMNALPDALFVIDVGYHKIAVAEAKKLGIPLVGVVDSNHSPEGIDYVIPGNDDSAKAVALYAKAVADAVLEGKANAVNDVVAAVAGGDEFVEVSEEA